MMENHCRLIICSWKPATFQLFACFCNLAMVLVGHLIIFYPPLMVFHAVYIQIAGTMLLLSAQPLLQVCKPESHGLLIALF